MKLLNKVKSNVLFLIGVLFATIIPLGYVFTISKDLITKTEVVKTTIPFPLLLLIIVIVLGALSIILTIINKHTRLKVFLICCAVVFTLFTSIEILESIKNVLESHLDRLKDMISLITSIVFTLTCFYVTAIFFICADYFYKKENS